MSYDDDNNNVAKLSFLYEIFNTIKKIITIFFSSLINWKLHGFPFFYF